MMQIRGSETGILKFTLITTITVQTMDTTATRALISNGQKKAPVSQQELFLIMIIDQRLTSF
jgi:hypothetical protein